MPEADDPLQETAEPSKHIGRPSPIDAAVDYDQAGNPVLDQTGKPITVADRIVQLLRIGCYFEHATAAAGVHRETGYEWLRTAGRARIRAKGRSLEDLNLTDHEKRCISFSDGVLRAAADYESRANATLQQLAVGGYSWTDTRTEYNGAGEVIKRTVEEKHLPPNPQVLEWRLTRRFMSRYGDRIEVIADEPAVPEEEMASDLVTSLRAFQETKRAEQAAKKGARKRGAREIAGADTADEGENRAANGEVAPGSA